MDRTRSYFILTFFYFPGKMILQQLRILRGMVAVFVFCQCFTIVADFYELICTLGLSSLEGGCSYNVHIENLINVAHFMLSINSSINFIFYMTNIHYFRESFVQVKNQLAFVWSIYTQFYFHDFIRINLQLKLLCSNISDFPAISFVLSTG